MAEKVLNWTTMNQAKMIALEARIQKRQYENQQKEQRQKKAAKTNKAGIPISLACLDSARDGERIIPKLVKGTDAANTLTQSNMF